MNTTEPGKKTGLDLLREPFPDHQISKLPKPLKKRDEMDKLPKATCKLCGGYHATSSMIHLDYVGHAALTDRLLDADPNWTWEPLAVGTDGYPVIDKDGGMWIKLTVCGVTRLGYGDAQGKTGGDAMKERIGDALRNAAMRFGAALELWHKGELHLDGETHPESPAATPAPATRTAAPASKDAEYVERIRAALKTLYGTDRESALDTVSKLTTWTDKITGEVKRPGIRDYTKVTGKSAEILCHELEKMVKKMPMEREPGCDDQ